MTIDYKALAERIASYAADHDLYAEQSGTEVESKCRRIAADLRTVVSLLEGMANAEPIYFVLSGDSWVEVSKEMQARHGTKWQRTLYTHPAPQPLPEKCGCRSCLTPAELLWTFVVCPKCGDKRCPRADDHRNACTDSNDPGQPQPEPTEPDDAAWCDAAAFAAMRELDREEAQPEAQIEARDALLDFISENGTASEGVQHYLDRYVRAALAARESKENNDADR